MTKLNTLAVWSPVAWYTLGYTLGVWPIISLKNEILNLKFSISKNALLGYNFKSTANMLLSIVDCLQPQSKNIFAPNKLLSQMLSSRFNKK